MHYLPVGSAAEGTDRARVRSGTVGTHILLVGTAALRSRIAAVRGHHHHHHRLPGTTGNRTAAEVGTAAEVDTARKADTADSTEGVLEGTRIEAEPGSAEVEALAASALAQRAEQLLAASQG